MRSPVFGLVAIATALQATSLAAQARTLVAVFAHPDDETTVGPILARYAREGATVHLIIATDGSQGTSNTSLPKGPEVARVRAEEARCATDALGIQPPVLLGFPDGNLGSFTADASTLYRLTQRLHHELQRLRPDVIITWGPDGPADPSHATRRSLRRSWSDDCDAVLSVWAAASAVAHSFLDEQFLLEERRNIADVHLPMADTWVWEESGRVAGFIALAGNEVGGLFVDPLFHRRGIGRALIDHVRGLHQELYVEVFRDNTIGRSFYAAYGFIEIDQSIHETTGLVVLGLPAKEKSPTRAGNDG